MGAMDDVSMNTNMHAAFKREIRRIQAGLTKAELSDQGARARLAKRYSFFSDTLHHHHEGEDQYLFDRVKPKASPAEVAVLDQMEAEHGQLNEILTTLDGQFAAISADTDKQEVSNQLDALFDVLTQHCDDEEQNGIQIVQRYVSEHDVKEFMKFTRDTEYAKLVLPWVCDNAEPGVEDQTWGMIPGPVRLFLKPMMTRKYDAFSRECAV